MKFTVKCSRGIEHFEKKSIRAAKIHAHKIFPNTAAGDKILKTEDGQTFIFDNEWFEITDEDRKKFQTFIGSIS